ncbi:MAG: hypothetical protein Q9167_005094 [Letrouitia subvulpina]
MGTIIETGANEYTATPLSEALRKPIYKDAYPAMFEIFGPGFNALPDFLSKSNYANPENPTDGAFQLGHKTTDHLFEWMSQRPEHLTNFQNLMAGYRAGQASWMDPGFYPIETNLVRGASSETDSPFLVDVGGGKGHDLQRLWHKHPKLPGKLILQDLRGVIEEAKKADLNDQIQLMEHDFFTKQPISGNSQF